jgi:integrase
MKQSGYVFRKGDNWFLRYRDTFVENGQLARRQVCKILTSVAPDHARLRKPPESVLALAEAELRPLNAGDVKPEHNVTLAEFVERVYFANKAQELSASTIAGYKGRWEPQLAPRCGHIRLREFRTPDAQRVLADIGRCNPKMPQSTLDHFRSLLSGIFRYAIQQGYLTGANPIREASAPRAPEGEETYAYSLVEELAMLKLLPDPARTIVATAAFVGLSRSELRGLQWPDYSGHEIRVMRGMWNSTEGRTKTRKRKAPVPVIQPMQQLLDQYRASRGKPTTGPIFASMKGTPLFLENEKNRVILPILNACVHCGWKPEIFRNAAEEMDKVTRAHPKGDHEYERDSQRPAWHGWHAFRRGLATNLHDLGVDDKTIQAILRHANVAITQAAYIKTLDSQSIAAMKQLETLVNAKMLALSA